MNEPGFGGKTIGDIIRECVMCDVHGFLVTAKNDSGESSDGPRQRMSKHSLVEFSFSLAEPEQQAASDHLMTRMGDSKDGGQMLMKLTARSGAYAMCIRYLAAGVGTDTEKWQVCVTDDNEREKRHRGVLLMLRDQILSPSGAVTSKMLPHLTGLEGAIVIRSKPGRAPVWSALDDNFIPLLSEMADTECEVGVFRTPHEFQSHMQPLLDASKPFKMLDIRPADGKTSEVADG